jgi:predicted transcriptional regulator
MHPLNPAPGRPLTGAAAALLVDSRRNRFLMPFLGRARGVSEVAAELNVGRSLVSYWVGRLRRLGLLEQLPGSAGRPRYRASADVFEVPLQDVPLDSLEDILAAQMDPAFATLKSSLLSAALRFGHHWVYRAQRGPNGIFQELRPRSGSLADARIVNFRGRLCLTRDDAAQLRDDLAALHARYAALSQPGEPGRQPMLMWVAAVDTP